MEVYTKWSQTANLHSWTYSTFENPLNELSNVTGLKQAVPQNFCRDTTFQQRSVRNQSKNGNLDMKRVLQLSPWQQSFLLQWPTGPLPWAGPQVSNQGGEG